MSIVKSFVLLYLLVMAPLFTMGRDALPVGVWPSLPYLLDHSRLTTRLLLTLYHR